MFCSNCGKEIADGANFCSGCGCKIGEASPIGTSSSSERTVTIKREGVLGAGPMRVLIDDSEYGIVYPGEEKSFPVPNGSHRLQILCTSTAYSRGRTSQNQYYSDVIFIKQEDPSMNFSASLNLLGKINIKKY